MKNKRKKHYESPILKVMVIEPEEVIAASGYKDIGHGDVGNPGGLGYQDINFGDVGNPRYESGMKYRTNNYDRYKR